VQSPRLWNIVLHQHGDASCTARVWVDGKLLLPDCVGRPAAAALEYVGEALVDVRPEDRLALRVQGGAAIRTWRAEDVESATRWLSQRVEVPSTCSDGAKSGTRPIVSGSESWRVGNMGE
jgi:hypothetical protein